MDGINIEKNILLKIGKENGVSEKGLKLLNIFINGDWKENVTEAFIFATLSAGLVGNSSNVIAERLKCERTLNLFRNFRKIKEDFSVIDALDERLMIENI